MIKIRKSSDRGQARYGWLDTKYTFSFADYYDPNFMGFKSLRVINEDIIAPRQGFDMHSHQDMEIVTYIISGKLEHKDSLGNVEISDSTNIQYMTAGSGITHSEFNASDEPLHLLQIWILPTGKGYEPNYRRTVNPIKVAPNILHERITYAKIANASIPYTGDNFSFYSCILETNELVTHRINFNMSQWIQVISGKIEVNGVEVSTGDGAAIEDENENILNIKAIETSEFILIDLVKRE